MKLHLFAHNQENLARVGDTIKKGNIIGTIGNANGAYSAHLHYSISEGLTPQELKSYVSGWSKEKVEKYYIKPNEEEVKGMFDRAVDVGNMGYGWLDNFDSGLHPGVDVNGLGGGNTDLGYDFRSPINGKVIASENWGGGWGNIIIIEELMSDNCFGYEEKHIKNLEKIARHVEKKTDYDYKDRPNNAETEEMLEKLDKMLEGSVCECEEIENELRITKNKLAEAEGTLKENRENINGYFA